MPTLELQVVNETPVQPADIDRMKRADVPAIVAEYRAELEKLKHTADTLTVTSSEQKAEMKIARATRLAIREIRLGFTERHKELKADALKTTQMLDSAKREIIALCEPLEARMEEQEKFAERLAAQQKAELKAQRDAELAPWLDEPNTSDLSNLSDVEWARTLAGAQAIRKAKLEAAVKIEAERIAKEKADAEAREAQRLENERLKKLADEQAAELAKEREAAERAAQEAKAKLQAEREKAAKEAQEAACKARKEREAAEAKAKAEREAIEAKAKAEREKADAEHAAEVARLAKEAAKLAADAKRAKDAQEAKAKADALAVKKAAAASDNDKLRAFADAISHLPLPEIAHKELRAEIAMHCLKLAAWIESQIGK